MPTNKKRCAWCGDDELYQAYHDQEWGVPTFDEQELFERLILEGMQAGLAWITVLRKRDHMRDAFFQFDIEKLARAREATIKRWLANEGIIRHRGKLEAMIGNAQLVRDMDNFPAFIWQFQPENDRIYKSLRQVPSETKESQAMSKALKKQGFRFVGPTICYAFMQSVGMVNDHVQDCWRLKACARAVAKARKTRPMVTNQ